MRKRFSKKEVKELNNELQALGLEGFIDAKAKVESDEEKIFVEGKLLFFRSGGKIAPTLLLEKDVLKKIAVDMGAVKFVCNGADIMRPGIVNADEDISKGEFVYIVDVQHGKKLAVGEMLFSGSEVMQMQHGKVIKNLHYVGDGYWNS